MDLQRARNSITIGSINLRAVCESGVQLGPPTCLGFLKTGRLGSRSVTATQLTLILARQTLAAGPVQAKEKVPVLLQRREKKTNFASAHLYLAKSSPSRQLARVLSDHSGCWPSRWALSGKHIVCLARGCFFSLIGPASDGRHLRPASHQASQPARQVVKTLKNIKPFRPEPSEVGRLVIDRGAPIGWLLASCAKRSRRLPLAFAGRVINFARLR